MVGISVGEQHFLKGGIVQDLRTDGRKRLNYRPISVETGVIPQANGSARVKIGETDVIASVKAEIGRPSSLQPDKGKVTVFVDCSPTAEPTFAVAKVEQVCNHVYAITVLAEVADGEQPEIDISDEEYQQFDTSTVPVMVTLTKVGTHYVVDATAEEESQISSAVSVSVNRVGHICGLIKRGGPGLDPSVILDIISVAKHLSETLMNKLDSEISATEACEDDDS